jgi:hypothetical protein
MAQRTHIEMPNGDMIDIKTLVDQADCDQRLGADSLAIYTVSCDNILFRTCVRAGRQRSNMRSCNVSSSSFSSSQGDSTSSC